MILKLAQQINTSMRKLVNVYTKQVRSVLELSVPAWQSRLSEADKMAIERVQKASLRIILGDATSMHLIKLHLFLSMKNESS